MYEREEYRFPITQVQEHVESTWSIVAIDAYQPIQDTDGWLKCTRCQELPRLWIFNNGSTAQCLCKSDDWDTYHQYAAPPIRVESICSSMKRSHNGQSMADYDSGALREVWNLFAVDGIARNKLPEGQW